MERLIEQEFLNELTPEQARRSLGDLVRINRYLGGHRILRRVLDRLACRSDRFNLLDVGAASGDMGASVAEAFPNAVVTSFDRSSAHLSAAGFPKVVGDAFALPFRERSFDYVFSSLFLHHFEDEDVVRLLSGFARIARKAVIAIDLERSALAYYFLPATRWLFTWDRVTLHDGKASVRAAFRNGELLSLARKAGLARADVRQNAPWFRLSLVASVEPRPLFE